MIYYEMISGRFRLFAYIYLRYVHQVLFIMETHTVLCVGFMSGVFSSFLVGFVYFFISFYCFHYLLLSIYLAFVISRLRSHLVYRNIAMSKYSI